MSKIEDKEALGDIILHAGVKVFLNEIEEIVQRTEMSVLKFDLSSGDEKELVRRKCRAEGARNLYYAIKTRVEELKQKKLAK